MEAMVIYERHGKWVLRIPGDVFPLKQGEPAEVMGFLRNRLGSRATVVKLEKESGEIQELMFPEPS